MPWTKGAWQEAPGNEPEVPVKLASTVSTPAGVILKIVPSLLLPPPEVVP